MLKNSFQGISPTKFARKLFTLAERQEHWVVDVIRPLRCAVKRRWTTAGDKPARELDRSGSNRSGGGGNKAAGASGVEGRIGDLASLQVVM
ncbi:MAG: hypothetical protein DMG84_22065 [Acidobacteria bacterium]|nr:MAG: hypothetical protein DMG84_22065 [Acidobacteriota bacterium]